MSDPYVSLILCLSYACQTSFFCKSYTSTEELEGCITRKPKRQRNEFTKEGNPDLALFDMGNNVDHVGLQVDVNPTNRVVATTQYPNVDDMVGELITRT